MLLTTYPLLGREKTYYKTRLCALSWLITKIQYTLFPATAFDLCPRLSHCVSFLLYPYPPSPFRSSYSTFSLREFQLKTCCSVSEQSFRSVCEFHFNFLSSICTATSSYGAHHHSYSFTIKLGQKS